MCLRWAGDGLEIGLRRVGDEFEMCLKWVGDSLEIGLRRVGDKFETGWRQV